MSPLDLHGTWILAERNAVFWFYLPLTVSAKPRSLLRPAPDGSKRNEAGNFCKSCSSGSSSWCFRKAHLRQGFPVLSFQQSGIQPFEQKCWDATEELEISLPAQRASLGSPRSKFVMCWLILPGMTLTRA